ncbi:hypothetical protein ACK8P5_21090 [Paenibacillus sp. EC2-1]|uniref:hypothetical protein n=1 Tax=Paenibacillus sp. EC2-1 TaxID=3388665 RepID=UPI003BEED233
MAEAINYRMNLVIDPKNVIKANRELRAMERYFERIQGRVLKIGRTRMAPEIVLKDSASKGLDSLLAKINKVKSEVIQASANVNLNVKVKQTGGQKEFSPMTKALQVNNKTINKMTLSIGKVGAPGGAKEEKSKSIWDKIKDGFGVAKSIGGGVKSAAEIPEKIKALGDAWKGKEQEKCCCSNGIMARRKPSGTSKGSKKGGNPGGKGGKFVTSDDSRTPSRIETRGRKRGRLRKTAGAAGALLETIGSAGGDLIGGFQGLGKLFGKKKGSSGIVSSASKSMTISGGIMSSSSKSMTNGNGIAASATKSMAKSGGNLISNAVKGFGKRMLGPLGFAADVASIATAAPGKERSQAIGSAVGGGAGAAIGGFIGSIIPGAGTLVGSALGGTAGSWLGEKAGGLISDASNKIQESASKVTDWFSSKFSFGKKKNKAEDIANKPAAITPRNVVSSTNATGLSHSYSASSGSFAVPPNAFGPPPALTSGPRIQAASNPVNAGGKLSSQVVQISPEQMTSLTGLLRDFKQENTTNYNLPPGAVQVTVREEHPVDVEGLIMQVGQRLRAELTKAAQNRKPGPMAY